MKEKLEEAVNTLRVDYMDIRIEDRHETRIQYLGKKLEQLGETDSFGGTVRVRDKGRWGIVSFTDMDDFDKSIFLAAREAKTGKSEDYKLAESPAVEDYVKKNISADSDPININIDEKEKLVRDYNDMILSSDRINNSSVFYKDVDVKKYFVSSEGTYVEQDRTECGMSIQAIAKDGTNVQKYADSLGGIDGFGVVKNLDDKIKEISEKAASLLDAKPAKGGHFDCLIDQRMAGTFIHEAFGHMSESDHICGNDKLQKEMVLGRKIGVEALTAIDDGTMEHGMGTNKYDDEGVLCQKNYLITDGKISGRLHSKDTAGKMGEKVSGNARAIDFKFEPIVRMTNTYIEPRDWTFEEMLAGIENGYYVKGSQGGMTNLDVFTFSAGEAYKVENGKLGEKVRDLTLTGNIFDTMNRIDAIGNDLIMYNSGGSGGCGKAGQAPLPIGRGGPHLVIRDVIVGGR